MRLYFSYVANGNPFLSFGKAGKYITSELSKLCDVVGEEEARGADAQMYLGIPLWQQRKLYRRVNDQFYFFTMWESPQVPQGHVNRINQTEGLITPCSWCDHIYKTRGVTVPRFVVPLGFDPSVYKYVERPNRNTFTFLWLGVNPGHIKHLSEEKKRRTGDRKRGWMVREAFERLKLKSDAQLILKSIPWPSASLNLSYGTPSGSRIHELSCWLPEDDLAKLIFEADVLVWPTWGEGFGMPPIEMAATGIPSILPNYSGLEDYFDPSWCIGLPYTYGRIWEKRPEFGARITMETLMEKMLWSYEHQEDVRQMGREAVRAVNPIWTWENKTRPALKQVLNYTGGRL